MVYNCDIATEHDDVIDDDDGHNKHKSRRRLFVDFDFDTSVDET